VKVTAVIPVANRRELLDALLASMARQTRPFDELIVVDNASSDGAPDLARTRGARVIAMGRNAGFTAAVNRGIAEAAGEWIAVLNSDVELSPDWLQALIAANAWFATGKILNAADPSLIDGSWDLISRAACPWRAGNARLDGPLFSEPREIALAPFTALLARAELFRRVGALDERFESYLEDVDFGLRCAALGLAGRYVPAALARHHGSATLGKWHPASIRRMARNQVFLAAKHYPCAKWFWPILVGQALWFFVALRHGAGFAFLRGKFEGLRRFRELAGPGAQSLEAVVTASEREIRALQSVTGWDNYWKLYFTLARVSK
jgi:GT2 family glycosyltransferase